jgi:hypothetical protein
MLSILKERLKTDEEVFRFDFFCLELALREAASQSIKHLHQLIAS